jgi:hypothetical protein
MQEGSAIKLYVIRVLEIDYHDDGSFSYYQVESDERYGPFPSLPSMLGHVHDKLLEEIGGEIISRRH